MRILHTYDTCINFNEETENDGAPVLKKHLLSRLKNRSTFA